MNKTDKIAVPAYYIDEDDTESKSEYPRIVFGKKDMTLDEFRLKIYFNLRKYIKPLIKRN